MQYRYKGRDTERHIETDRQNDIWERIVMLRICLEREARQSKYTDSTVNEPEHRQIDIRKK